MTGESEAVVESDVIYADGLRPLRWNVFRPAAAGKKAAVLLYHGG